MEKKTSITAIESMVQVAEDLQQKHRFDSAIVKYQEVVEIDPHHWQSWRELAKLYQGQNQLPAATECLRKLIAIKPRQSNFYRDLVNLLLQQDKKAEIREICQQLIDLSPKQPLWVYKHLNNIDKSEDFLEKAIIIYQQAINQEESQPAFVYDSFLNALLEQSQFTEAYNIAQQAIKKYPQNPYLWMSLALSNYQLGNLEAARQNYQQVIELQPIPQAYFQLGNIYQEQNQLEKAIASYQSAQNLLPSTNISIHLKLGECYQQQQELQLAISTYEKVVFLIDNRYISRRIHSILSYLYRQQGATDLATKHYKLEIANNCLINHQHKIIYCPIAKNACTLFKSMMIEHSKDHDRYRGSQEDIHHYASSRKDTAVFLDDIDYLERPDYFKFAILRNPFARLVSAYLDKFVKHETPEIFAQELIRKVQQFLEQEYDLATSISFQEFMQYLANTQDLDLNEHWRSQSSFLGRGLLEFDYLGQFENLPEVIKDLENKFKFKITTNVIKNHNRTEHITNYITNILPDKYYAKYPQELRDLKIKNGGFPDTKYFYSSRLIELVELRFAQDIELYNSQFTEQIGERANFIFLEH